MRSFKDAKGRIWDLEVTVNAVKRVRSRYGVDLMALIDNQFAGLVQILKDQVALCDVIYVLIEDQAKARGLTDEDFGAGMAGDALADASDVFAEAYLDFFPDREIRDTVRELLLKSKDVSKILSRQALEEIRAADVDSLVAKLRKQFGSGQESAA